MICYFFYLFFFIICFFEVRVSKKKVTQMVQNERDVKESFAKQMH